MANNDAETSSRSISMSSGDVNVEVSDDVYSDDVHSDVVHSDVVIGDNCEGDDDDHGVSDDSKMIDAIVGCSEDVSRSNSSGMFFMLLKYFWNLYEFDFVCVIWIDNFG